MSRKRDKDSDQQTISKISLMKSPSGSLTRYKTEKKQESPLYLEFLEKYRCDRANR